MYPSCNMCLKTRITGFLQKTCWHSRAQSGTFGDLVAADHKVLSEESSFWPWSRVFVGIDNTSVFCLAFPKIKVGFSPLLFIGILQGIAAGIGTSNFLRTAFIVSLNSSSFGSMMNFPLNCLSLLSFGFSLFHLCFAFSFAASERNFHISSHTSSGREVVCFIVSLPPRPCMSFWWLFPQ